MYILSADHTAVHFNINSPNGRQTLAHVELPIVWATALHTSQYQIPRTEDKFTSHQTARIDASAIDGHDIWFSTRQGGLLVVLH